ncbi:N(5)-hydroxyornithine transformylase PvdF [Trinickia sp. LjRoot230]|uniref:formyltransferase family protein n=1 Tax=Trinickia sp. LjRoot230 TaxID=3342288 RepID=UPI003ECCEAD8
MSKKNLVYILSLRNAAADRAGQQIEYKGSFRYMKSPLEHLVQRLNETALGDVWSLAGIIYDDDEGSPKDHAKLRDYGFSRGPGRPWIVPPGLIVQGKPLDTLMHSVPSAYRCSAGDAHTRAAGKRAFETRLAEKLVALEADFVVLDGLLVILDELVRPGATFYRRIANIHPGITRLGSRYERRGAYATLDALYGARGEKVVDWHTRQTCPVPLVDMTGASFHYVDNGIDSGEVIADVLATPINPCDTILELRWNNFNRSLFPALDRGLSIVAESFAKEGIR